MKKNWYTLLVGLVLVVFCSPIFSLPVQAGDGPEFQSKVTYVKESSKEFAGRYYASEARGVNEFKYKAGFVWTYSANQRCYSVDIMTGKVTLYYSGKNRWKYYKVTDGAGTHDKYCFE